ncbi:hypothetical protein HYQ44_002533 [Verticillium longisporum]|nr:hypothetical protein HYQ44_002533 [Verticillium longisporum]
MVPVVGRPVGRRVAPIVAVITSRISVAIPVVGSIADSEFGKLLSRRIDDTSTAAARAGSIVVAAVERVGAAPTALRPIFFVVFDGLLGTKSSETSSCQGSQTAHAAAALSSRPPQCCLWGR